MQHLRPFLRIVATVVCALGTFYFAGFLVGVLGDAAHLPPWIATVISILISVAAARFIWTHVGSPHPGLARSVGIGALLTGAVAFSAGFFGPMIFTPNANQGPLLGIFITGPLGLILGALGGALYWLIRRTRANSTGDDDAS